MSNVETSPAGLRPARLLIGDRWLDDSSGGQIDHVSPRTGKPQASITLAGASEVDQAVTAARQAFPAWRALRPDERRDLLLKFAAAIESDAEGGKAGLDEFLQVKNVFIQELP